MMEELTRMNGKGVCILEIENDLRRYGASLEWLMKRIGLREQEMEEIRTNAEMK